MGRFQNIGAIQPFLKLHEGIWADVYKAFDTSLERYVLLKLLKPEFAGNTAIAAQFEAEAQLMARIEHPNVVKVLSFGREGPAVYFVAEFIEGVSLEGLLEARRIPPILATHIIKEATAGLLAAHRQNIFHRDIKPSNILVSSTGAVKLTDFGMSTLMIDEEPNTDDGKQGAIRGTLAYLGPEHVFDAAPTVTSDLFSLGATYFEMLAGQPAFRGNNPSEIFDRVLHYDPLPFLASNPAIPRDIIHICDRLLKKDPAHRFQETESLLAELETVLSGLSVPVTQDSVVNFLEDPASYSDPEKKTDPANPQTPAAVTNTSTSIAPSRRKFSARAYGLATAFLLVLVVILATNLGGGTPALVENTPVATPQEDSLSTTGQPIEQPSASISSTEPQPPPDRPVDQAGTLQTQAPTEVEKSAPGTAAVIDTLRTDQDVATEQNETGNLFAPGSLAILCSPWCNVWVNGDSLGQSPSMRPASLAPGLHNLVFKHPSFPPVTQDIRIEAGQTDSIKIALWDHVGVIDLDVVPWAEVYIDGVHHGPVPPGKSIILAPGTYELALKNESIGDVNTTLIIAAGEKKKLSYNLNERLP